MIKVVAFDCFGTLFNMDGVSRDEIKHYVAHVRKNDFTPYDFPKSWWDLKAFDDVKPGIEKLQSMGLRCVALSNGSHALLRHLAACNDFDFDFVVDLVFHRVYKPHAAAYLTIEKDIGVAPVDTLMVTANPTFGDIEGSGAVGMFSQVIRHGYPHTVLELADTLGRRISRRT